MSGTPRILTLDIETSPMQVWTFSLFKPFISYDQIIQDTRVISWAAKWYGEEQMMFMSEYHNGREKMLRKMHELLSEADIVIHFNGESFDIPHLRREFKQLGLPPFAPFQTIDLFKQLKKAMYFPSNKLDNIARQLSVGQKVAHTGFQLWVECMTESPADDPHRQRRAWALMRKYNKGDVIVTEDLYTETRTYLPNHPHLGLYRTELSEEDTCDVCDSNNLRLEGFAYTKVGKYQRYQCRECGRWGKGKRALAIVEGRGVAS
jgi:DNA polymerase elongation subunit (family B)